MDILALAGLSMEDRSHHAVILELLEKRRQRSGWRIKTLDGELIATWRTLDQTLS
jgi:hypothetical protein